jgi:hypothetical protein
MGCVQRFCGTQIFSLGDENVETGILTCDLTRKVGCYDGASDIPLLPSKLILGRRAALPFRRRFFVRRFSTSDLFPFFLTLSAGSCCARTFLQDRMRVVVVGGLEEWV